jgi:hypothetical protein
VLEGVIPESVEYEDWISDSNTWRDLGEERLFMIVCLHCGDWI